MMKMLFLQIKHITYATFFHSVRRHLWSLSLFHPNTGRTRGNETKKKREREKRTTINTKMIYKYILWCLFSNPFKHTQVRTRTYIKKAGWMFINILYARHGNVAAEECNCSVGNIPRRSLAHIKRENLRHVCDNIPNKSQRGPQTPWR